jgi:site-specific recombinase XerD
MNDLTLLGPWVRRFLLEHLVAERNLARNTQRSYRDALAMLIPFVADKLHQSVDRLTVINVSADLVRLFLTDLEQSRTVRLSPATSAWRRSMLWLGLWENTVQSTLPGVVKFVPFPSRRRVRH